MATYNFPSQPFKLYDYKIAVDPGIDEGSILMLNKNDLSKSAKITGIGKSDAKVDVAYGVLPMSIKDAFSKQAFDDMVQALASKYALKFDGGDGLQDAFTYEPSAVSQLAKSEFIKKLDLQANNQQDLEKGKAKIKAAKIEVAMRIEQIEAMKRQADKADLMQALREQQKEAMMQAALDRAKREDSINEGLNSDWDGTVITGNWISRNGINGIVVDPFQESQEALIKPRRTRRTPLTATPATPATTPEPLRKGRMILLKDPE